MTRGKIVVEVETCHGIKGRIVLLGLREGVGFPIGEALTFGNSFSEHDAVDFAETVVGNPEAFHESLEVDEVLRRELGELVEIMEIIMHRQPDFHYFAVFKKIYEGLWETNLIEPEKEAYRFRAKLHKGHLVGHTLAEAGSGFRIKAYHLRLSQGGDSLGDILGIVNHAYVAVHLGLGKVGEQFFRYCYDGPFLRSGIHGCLLL